jgi:uncharacterized protein (DUF433 family)
VGTSGPGELIVSDPSVAFGEATIRGTRIWVTLILGLLAEGVLREELLREYPSLSQEAIDACTAHGQQLAGQEYDVIAP